MTQSVLEPGTPEVNALPLNYCSDLLSTQKAHRVIYLPAEKANKPAARIRGRKDALETRISMNSINMAPRHRHARIENV